MITGMIFLAAYTAIRLHHVQTLKATRTRYCSNTN